MEKTPSNGTSANNVTSAPEVPKSLDKQIEKKLDTAVTKPEKSIANVNVPLQGDALMHAKRKQSKIRLDSSEEESDAEPMVQFCLRQKMPTNIVRPKKQRQMKQDPLS